MSESNWTDITHDKEVMDRVMKGIAKMQDDVLKKAERIKKAMKNEPRQHEEDNITCYSRGERGGRE